MSRAPWAACLVAASLAATTSVVRSEPSGNDRALEEQVKAGGDSLMQERRYTEALDAYNRAFDFYPDPRLHYNRASAYLALGRYPEALDQLETFRSRAPTALQEKVPDLDALIETTRAKVSSIGVITPVRGALVTWRGQVIGTTPLAHPHRVNTSPGTLEIIADGYEPYREDLVLTGKRTLTLEPHLVRRAGATLLVVHSPVLGARVALDGRDLGLVPAEAIVAPGSHRIAVTHADYERAEVSAVVAQGQSRTVDVQLEGTKPIYAKWWFWTGVGVAVAGTVTAIIIANTSRSADTGDIQPGKVSAPLKLQGLMRF